MSIDGTHLYGKYKGMLMISMGYDGNNQFFPWHLLLQNEIILIARDDSWHLLETR